MKVYNLVLLSILYLIPTPSSGQNKDEVIRNLFSSVVYLSDSTSQRAGTGFLISKDLDDFLVTAEHVARIISSNGQIQYRNGRGESKEIPINILTTLKRDSLLWIKHPIADVAVLHLSLREMDSIDLSSLDIGSISYSALEDSLIAPDRLTELTVFGFPLNLGVSPSV